MWGFPGGTAVNSLPANSGGAKGMDLTPGSGKSHAGGNEISSRVLAWKIPRTEEPGGPHSTGLQRVRHDWARAHAHTHTHNMESLKAGCFYLAEYFWDPFTFPHVPVAHPFITKSYAIIYPKRLKTSFRSFIILFSHLHLLETILNGILMLFMLFLGYF